ncbi:MAG: ATP-binding protein [Acidobacteriales bacterium]|nr:ATP-binding protein [Terriglobales bacterium]
MANGHMPECPQGCGAREVRLSYDIPADLEQIPHIVEEVVDLATKSSPPESEAPQAIALCLQEAIVNAVVHGSKEDKQKHVQCWVALGPEDILMVVRDSGPGFDFVHPPNPLGDEGLGLDHGRGVLLMQQLMDDVHYLRNGAELHMVKKLT